MSCCVPTIFTFTNVPDSVIGYTPSLAALYGTYPKVQVMYLDPETGEFYIAPWFTRIAFVAGQIRIDHGGPNSGIISVS